MLTHLLSPQINRAKSARSMLTRVATVAVAILLVSALVYQRSGGDLLGLFARRPEAGLNPAPAWTGTADPSASPADGGKSKMTAGTKTIIMSPKAGMIVMTFPFYSGDVLPIAEGGAAPTRGAGAPQGAECRGAESRRLP